MNTSLNTPTAAAFHQLANAVLPTGHRAETYGDSTSGRVSATVFDATGQEVAYQSGSTAAVLAQLENLSFPATDAFPRC